MNCNGLKWIKTDDVFETGLFQRVWTFSEDFETDFGLKQNGGELWGVTRGYERDCWEFARKVLVFR